MRVLVTGGCGMIGSYIVEKFISEGHKVSVIDRLLKQSFTDKPFFFPGVKYCFGNLSDRIDVDIISFIYENLPDIVIHNAAIVGVSQSFSRKYDYFMNNVMGTIGLLDSLDRAFFSSEKKPRIILSSSMGLYGQGSVDGKTKEDFPQNPQSFYAITKQSQEQIIKKWLADERNRGHAFLRFFSVYSERINPQNPYTGIIHILKDIRDNPKSKFEIYEDGNQGRDFIHAKDVANFVYEAAVDEKIEGAYNVGTGIETTINELAQAMKAKIKPNGKKRTGDIYRMCADMSNTFAKFYSRPMIDVLDYASTL